MRLLYDDDVKATMKLQAIKNVGECDQVYLEVIDHIINQWVDKVPTARVKTLKEPEPLPDFK